MASVYLAYWLDVLDGLCHIINHKIVQMLDVDWKGINNESVLVSARNRPQGNKDRRSLFAISVLLKQQSLQEKNRRAPICAGA